MPSGVRDRLDDRPLAKRSMGISPHTAIWIATGLILGPAILGWIIEAYKGGAHAGHRTHSPVGAYVYMGVVVFLTSIAPALSRAINIRWLERLELPLDLDGYLGALDVAAGRGALVVEATWAGDATPEVDTPHRGSVDVAPGRLKITSPVMPTVANGRVVTPHNASLRRWFRRVCDDVLVPLNGKVPLQSVTVRRIVP